MSTNSIKVMHFDDEGFDQLLCPNILFNLCRDLLIKFDGQVKGSIKEAIDSLQSNEFDLIILDLLDQEDKPLGYAILDFLHARHSNTPVIIYTQASPRDRDYRSEVETKYSHIFEFVNKNVNIDDIRNAFIRFLRENNYIPEIYEADKHDYSLQADLSMMDRKEVNNVLINIREIKKLSSISKMKISRITSGFSGAALFRVDPIDGESFLLKVSKDEKIIKKESDNVKIYEQFPRSLRLSYDAHSYNVISTNNLFALIIEFAKDTKTFFDYIFAVDSAQEALNNLFYKDGLVDHYKNHRVGQEIYMSSCLSQLDERRQTFIFKSINDLKSILRDFEMFDEELIITITRDQCYKNLRHDNTPSDKYKKPLLLCHGDLHSKNILLSQNDKPTLIDTGGISYMNWSMDLARLIVDLFIGGMDFNSINYFELKSINSWLEQLDYLINLEEIQLLDVDKANERLINVINWLTKNVDSIYGDLFEKWEFQVGMAVEFFKASYKSISLPPGKRVLGLLAGCECVRQANENFKLREGK